MALGVFGDTEVQYAKDKRLRREDVAAVGKWQRLQPHLPAPIHPMETIICLHSCDYNNEMTKQLIDSYYTHRTHCPEFFADRDPFNTDIQKMLNATVQIVLPEATPNDNLVFYGRLQNPNPDVFNCNVGIKLCAMVAELGIHKHGCHHGHIAIIDLKGATMAHLLKCNLLSMKKALAYLGVAPLRFTSINIVNGVPFMDKIITIVRTFLRKDLMDMLHVHYGDNSTIFKYVPKDMLPIECGGSKFCATDYYNNVTRKHLESSLEYFEHTGRQVVDESKRPGKPKNAADLYGVEGTFKHLDID